MKKKIFLLITIIFLCNSLSWAELPQWSVDASKYEFSMTFTSAIYVDGKFVSGEDNMLAAFVGGQVRGVASPVYDQYHDRWLFFLTVFSNQFTGENVTFMFYDAALDDAIDLWNEVSFANATNHGSISNPYVLFTEHPAGNSTVVFWVENENGEAVTDAVVVFNQNALAQGTYQVDDVEPGSYSWSVARQGYVTSSGEVAVGAETPIVEVRVTLQPSIVDNQTYEIHFFISGLSGNLIEDVEILLNGEMYLDNRVIKGLEPAQYSYKVSKNGYISREGQITILSSNIYIDIILLEQSMSTINPDSIEIRLYPNPATSFVRIDAAQQTLISAIEVYNTSGRQVMFAEGFSFGDSIDISPLAKGMYLFIIVLQNGERITEKLIIN